MTSERRILVGITGASGSIYAVRLVRHLAAAGAEVHVIATEAGIRTMGLELERETLRRDLAAAAAFHEDTDIAAPPASGMFAYDAYVVVPCSVNTIGKIHSGIADSLLLRSCAVALKERRRLILVPRESPISAITLQQMADLAKLGCDVCVASPGFYARPRCIEDLVDFICAKVMSLAGMSWSTGEALRARYLSSVEAGESKVTGPT